ncbi:MAG TPA: hypothetical protein VH370_06720 [Humisphaera sp.]|jgi:hypothetical protein|nr:hypothetical protein [Humisphaera sp.]
MAAQAFILFPDDTTWRFCVVSSDQTRFGEIAVPARAGVNQLAELVADALQAAGYSGGGVMLAIPSAWCFSATISVANLPRRDRQAILYRLEEKLPLAAESLVADFILPSGAPGFVPSPLYSEERVRVRGGGTGVSPVIRANSTGETPVPLAGASSPSPLPSPPSTTRLSSSKSGEREKALGICARLDVLAPLIDALENAGIAVQSISPAAVLAAQHLAAQSAPGALLLSNGDALQQIDLMVLENENLVHWALLPANTPSIIQHLRLLALDVPAPAQFIAAKLPADLAQVIGQSAGVPIDSIDIDPMTAAALAGADHLAGKSPAWIELRRGPLAIADRLRLHRRPLNAMLAAVVALLFIGAAAMFVRAMRYDRVSDQSQREMTASFAEHFPGWATPVNVRVVIESEHRKAAGEHGAAPPPAASGKSALITLRDVIGHLPTDGKVTVERMTFADKFCDVEGRLQSYEDADAVAAAARAAGMEVAPPQTHKLTDGSWSFTVHGTFAQKSLSDSLPSAPRTVGWAYSPTTSGEWWASTPTLHETTDTSGALAQGGRR